MAFRVALVLFHRLCLQNRVEYVVDSQAIREAVFLRQIHKPQVASARYVTGVRVVFACQ